MMNVVGDESILERLERVEARLAIGQLPIRYALAVDARDVDSWLALFVPEVQVGRDRFGREALREYIEPRLRLFYRSMHQVCGHHIELEDPDHARGSVYCRAEQEFGDRWIVLAVCYFDTYQRIDGEWLFARRKERLWYTADVTERPQAVGFHGWPEGSGPADLPHAFESWVSFRETGDEPGDVTQLP